LTAAHLSNRQTGREQGTSASDYSSSSVPLAGDVSSTPTTRPELAARVGADQLRKVADQSAEVRWTTKPEDAEAFAERFGGERLATSGRR
jgi:hypothetical protein